MRVYLYFKFYAIFILIGKKQQKLGGFIIFLYYKKTVNRKVKFY